MNWTDEEREQFERKRALLYLQCPWLARGGRFKIEIDVDVTHDDVADGATVEIVQSDGRVARLPHIHRSDLEQHRWYRCRTGWIGFVCESGVVAAVLVVNGKRHELDLRRSHRDG